jgi:hypothetical protein
VGSKVAKMLNLMKVMKVMNVKVLNFSETPSAHC